MNTCERQAVASGDLLGGVERAKKFTSKLSPCEMGLSSFQNSFQKTLESLKAMDNPWSQEKSHFRNVRLKGPRLNVLNRDMISFVGVAHLTRGVETLFVGERYVEREKERERYSGIAPSLSFLFSLSLSLSLFSLFFYISLFLPFFLSLPCILSLSLSLFLSLSLSFPPSLHLSLSLFLFLWITFFLYLSRSLSLFLSLSRTYVDTQPDIQLYVCLCVCVHPEKYFSWLAHHIRDARIYLASGEKQVRKEPYFIHSTHKHCVCTHAHTVTGTGSLHTVCPTNTYTGDLGEIRAQGVSLHTWINGGK